MCLCPQAQMLKKNSNGLAVNKPRPEISRMFNVMAVSSKYLWVDLFFLIKCVSTGPSPPLQHKTRTRKSYLRVPHWEYFWKLLWILTTKKQQVRATRRSNDDTWNLRNPTFQPQNDNLPIFLSVGPCSFEGWYTSWWFQPF